MDNVEQNFPSKEPNNFHDTIERRSKKSAEIVRRKFATIFTKTTREEFREKHGFVPSNVTFSPTYACNLHCIDCYSGDRKKPSTKLDDETIDRTILESTEKWAVPFFTITGGESLSQAIQIAQRHPEIPFQLYTNGTLITEQIAEEIAELGNLFPFVSIEGLKEETDRIRGNGIYEKVLAVMDLLTKKGIVWGVSFTLTANNADIYNSDDFLDALISKGALLGRFLTYMPTGRNADLRKIPSRDQRKKQGDALKKIVADGKLFYALDYLNNPDLVRGCAAAGLRYVHIDPSGDVYPCVFIAVPSIFNLRDAYQNVYEKDGLAINCLEDILVKDPLLKIAREIAKTRKQCCCCLVIDDSYDFKEACVSLAEEYPVKDFGSFFDTNGGKDLLKSYLVKLKNTSAL